MDDFEQQLCRQPMTRPPARWRDEILATARQGRTGLQPVTERKGNQLQTDLRTAISATNGELIETGHLSPECQPKFKTPLASTKDRLETCPTLLGVLRGWLWPHPGAWAALAAVWVFIFFMNHQIQVGVQHDIELAGVKAPAGDVINAFEERRLAVERLLASGDLEIPVLDRPPANRPRRTGSPPLMLLAT